MKVTAKNIKFLETRFHSPVIGDSIILYKAVYKQGRSKTKFRSMYANLDYNPYIYEIGKEATPNQKADPAVYGTCASGMHAGSLSFARAFNMRRRDGDIATILACLVKVSDIICYEKQPFEKQPFYGYKLRAKKLLPLGEVARELI
jgi:hypothetical protein